MPAASHEIHELWARDEATGTAVGVRLAAGRVGLVLLGEDGWRQERLRPAPAEATMADGRTTGHVGKGAWDLSFASVPGARPVALGRTAARLGLVPAALEVPGPAVRVSGTVVHKSLRLVLDGAPGAHLRLRAPSPPVNTWAGLHAFDLRGDGDGGASRPGDHLTAVTAVLATAAGRARPVTLVAGQLLGRPFSARSPAALARARSEPSPTRWELDVQGGGRRVIATAVTRPELTSVDELVADGGRCYNSPMADLRLEVLVRDGRGPGAAWRTEGLLVAPRRALLAVGGPAPASAPAPAT